MREVPPAAPRPGRPLGNWHYVGLCALVGLVAGAIGSVFHLALNVFLTWPRHLGRLVEGPLLVVCAALVTAVATVAVAAAVRRWAPEASGSGIQEVEGAMQGVRPLRWARVLPVKFFGGIVSIGSGLVLGREGPTIHIGASVAAVSSDLVDTAAEDRSALLAAGAAAGLACAFNAPIAAILFITEETRDEFPYSFRSYMGVIAAALLSTVATEWIGGKAPDLTMAAAEPGLAALPLFALLGAVLGGIGVVFNAAVLRTLDFAASAHRRAPYVFPAVVGLVVGALLVLYPHTVTGGESAILALTAAPPALQVLLVLAVVRFLTTVTSYSSGVPGGIFAPMLSLAACIGLAFGAVAEMALPWGGATATAFAIAAMGGLFTASVRSPLVGVVLTLELTGAWSLALPLLATCLLADLVAWWLGGKPIYEALLERTLAQEADATQARGPR